MGAGSAISSDSQYLDNLAEQSHRPVKERHHPMLGSGSFEPASRSCAAFEELRRRFRVRRRGEGHVPLARQRQRFLARWRSPVSVLAAAWGGRPRQTFSLPPPVTSTLTEPTALRSCAN